MQDTYRMLRDNMWSFDSWVETAIELEKESKSPNLELLAALEKVSNAIIELENKLPYIEDIED